MAALVVLVLKERQEHSGHWLQSVSQSTNSSAPGQTNGNSGKPCVRGEGVGMPRPVLGEGKGVGSHLGQLMSPGHGTNIA